ncbi:hypothetical protein ACTIVE_0722 [Actinomadura verrucosospora]|uniref:Uncharacterized protein n=2 Tax=Actinomadura verrucosospora TaxID=46165 RepID=A0A7D3ZUM8_ACTVE|nr:hypothetical protein ACTIVE_0722 [Actinomadura verrucosospora]
MNTPYVAMDAAHALKRAGLWDLALDLLPDAATALRAEILTDRFFWKLDDPAEAESAVAELSREDAARGGFHDAQLAYTRLLFGLDPRPGDEARVRAGFAAAAEDERLASCKSL